MEDVVQWFNGTKDYWEGVALYRQHGTNPALLEALELGPSEYRSRRLAQELRSVMSGEAATAPVGEPVLAEVMKSPQGPVLPNNNEALELYNKKVLLSKEKDFLRSRLPMITTDAERGAAAFRILQLRQEITLIWQQEEYLKAHGHISEVDTGVTAPQALKHRRTQVNQYMRRYRMQLNKDPTNKNAIRHLAKYTEEYERLQTKISAL